MSKNCITAEKSFFLKNASGLFIGKKGKAQWMKKTKSVQKFIQVQIESFSLPDETVMELLKLFKPASNLLLRLVLTTAETFFSTEMQLMTVNKFSFNLRCLHFTSQLFLQRCRFRNQCDSHSIDLNVSRLSRSDFHTLEDFKS